MAYTANVMSETTTSTSDSPTKRIRRQRLGIRLGLDPYYAIGDQTPSRLVLQSRPGSNTRAGRTPMGCGILLGLLTPLTIAIIMIQGTGSVNDAFFGVLLAWPFAAIGILIWRAGHAVATTSNTITVDSEQKKIVYEQQNRVNRPRSQTVQFEQIDHLRLRPRQLTVSDLPRRHRQIIALEFITDESHTWIIDSATDGSQLFPLARSLSALINRELHDLRSEQTTGAQNRPD